MLTTRRAIYSLTVLVVMITVLNESFTTNIIRLNLGLITTHGQHSHVRGRSNYSIHDGGTDIKIWRSGNSSVVNNTSDDDCVNLSSMSEQNSRNAFQPLPSSVVAGVKTLVFFIGIGRSGHSIVASILDSHPHMVISNELDLFEMLNKTSCTVDRSFIFNHIWERSSAQAATSLRDPSKGYTLAIDGLYQGSYRSHIDVIGDKMGGSTAAFFISNPEQFDKHLSKLRSFLNITIKVFHVIRNPFDNIATKVLQVALKLQYSKFAEVKEDNLTLTLNHKLIDNQIVQYFQFFEASQVIKHILHKYQMDMMELHNKDLITNPKVVISEMCDFLGIQCSDNYLNVASNKIFGAESKTRYNIKWNNEQISLVKENIQKYRILQGYLDFNS